MQVFETLPQEFTHKKLPKLAQNTNFQPVQWMMCWNQSPVYHLP